MQPRERSSKLKYHRRRAAGVQLPRKVQLPRVLERLGVEEVGTRVWQEKPCGAEEEKMHKPFEHLRLKGRDQI